MQCVLLHASYSYEDVVKFSVPQGSVFRPIRFSLFISDLPLHVKSISADCDMLADDTGLHTSGNDILQISSNIYPVRWGIQLVWQQSDSHQSDQDQVYGNRYQTETPAVTPCRTRSSGTLDLVLHGVKIDKCRNTIF